MNNIVRIRSAMRDGDYGAILLTSPVNRMFATGFESTAGAMLITDSGAWFFTDSRYDEAARAVVERAEVRLVTKDKPYSKQINALLAEQGITSVGFEDGEVTYSEYLEWKAKLTPELCPAQKMLESLRAVKSGSDLKGMIAAQRIAERSFEEVLPLIGTGISEKELAAELVYRSMKNGADDKSFDPIIVSGERSSMPHGVPGEHIIGEGFVTVDFGVKLGGWCSDTTRTLCVGKPTDEMVRVYDTVLAAQEAGIEAARAGVKGSEIDGAARRVIEEAGYGKYFGHGFGHGLGLEVHEPPNASPVFGGEIPAGAVISAEPGIYIPGRFGVRIEDVIFITEGGSVNITNLAKKLIIL